MVFTLMQSCSHEVYYFGSNNFRSHGSKCGFPPSPRFPFNLYFINFPITFCSGFSDTLVKSDALVVLLIWHVMPFAHTQNCSVDMQILVWTGWKHARTRLFHFIFLFIIIFLFKLTSVIVSHTNNSLQFEKEKWSLFIRSGKPQEPWPASIDGPTVLRNPRNPRKYRCQTSHIRLFLSHQVATS